MSIKPTDNFGTKKKILEIGEGRGYLQMAAAKEGWNTLQVDEHELLAQIIKRDRERSIAPLTKAADAGGDQRKKLNREVFRFCRATFSQNIERQICPQQRLPDFSTVQPTARLLGLPALRKRCIVVPFRIAPPPALSPFLCIS